MASSGRSEVPTQPIPAERGRSRPAAIPLVVWLLGFAVALLALTVCALWTLYTLRGQWAQSGPTPTPIIWTATPLPATPTPLPEATATPEPLPTPPAGIEIGGYVQVVGTGGAGLSLREGPGRNYARMGVALEGEIFLVVDGPAAADGVDWWKLRDLQDESRSWWAAANFLQPVAPP